MENGTALSYNKRTKTTSILLDSEDIVEIEGKYHYGESVSIFKEDIIDSHFDKIFEDIKINTKHY